MKDTDIELTASNVKTVIKEALEKEGYTLNDVEKMLKKQADGNPAVEFITKFLVPSIKVMGLLGMTAGGIAGGGLYGLHVLDNNTDKQLDKYRLAKEKIENATQNLKDTLGNPKASF